MVTGDNLHTAKAIALECGILDSEVIATDPLVIEGRAFRGLSDKERMDVAERISVRFNIISDFNYLFNRNKMIDCGL